MAPIMDPRAPVLPIAIEEDPDHVILDSNGDARPHINQFYSAEGVERIRTGYACINCGESQVDHGAPFPEQCWVCKYEIKAKQTERFAMEFKGTVRLGPSASAEDELLATQELVHRMEHERSMSQILLPSDLSMN